MAQGYRRQQQLRTGGHGDANSAPTGEATAYAESIVNPSGNGSEVVAPLGAPIVASPSATPAPPTEEIGEEEEIPPAPPVGA